MRDIRNIKFKRTVLLGLIITLTMGCERDLSDDATEATFATTGDIFIDNFVGMGTNFYLPFSDSKQDAFSVDENEGYESSASYRVDTPNINDPNGTYAGAILRVDGAGRDLTGFDALTFWAKASQGVFLDEVGFGIDFLEDTNKVSVRNLNIGTNWTKYIVPIPDASILLEERGVFWYADSSFETAGSGYILWFDEIKFEKLGTIAQPRPKILNGQDQFLETFIESVLPIGGLTQTFNSANGDITVEASPSYFRFTSSNTNVATVSELGVVTVVGSSIADPNTGELIPTVITATLDGIDAEGSLSLVSLGGFTEAPVPTEAPENVISLFSDTYTDVPVDYYNGFFNGDGQTTQGGEPPVNVGGGEVINYTDLNFVGIGTFLEVQPIDATQMTHLHVDINVQEAIDSGDFIRLQILNGVQTSNETSGVKTITGSELMQNEWRSFDIPLGEFTGTLSARDALGLLFFISDTTISNILVDNIYYYKEVVDPTDNVDDSAATQVELPIGFESSLTYDFIGFEGADSDVETNSDQSGINPTQTVMRSTKTVGAQFFAGTAIQLDASVDFSTSQKVRMKVWSPKAGIPILLRFEDQNNSAGVGIELVANTTTTNEWEELEWDFSTFNTTADFVRVIVFFEFVVGTTGDGSTYYFDDLKILE
tara:strand:- start:1035 stop:2999 length:1965 start_codon:yes stop_codon:yes gene_type:complete